MENKKLTTSLVASLLIATNLYSNKLSEITVYSATKSEQSIKDVTSNVEVITKEELEEKNYTNLTQALNSVQGIDITSNGGLGQTSFVRINGMHYTNTLVLIDGIRYNDITNGSAFPGNILITDVERIEIIKGAQSGVWGADASGGVINIITKKPENGLNGGINLEYGSFNTQKYGLNLSYKNEKAYVKLNAQRLTSDGYSAQATRGIDLDSFEDDSYENTTLSLKTGVNLNDSNKLDFTHTYIDSKTEYDGSGPNDSDDESKSKSNFSKINFNNVNKIGVVDIYFSKSKFDRKDPTGFTKEFESDVKEYGVKSNIKYREKDFLILGIDRKDFNQKKAYSFDYQNNGFYLTNSNFLNNNTTVFTQSLRYDTYTSFKNKITGKIGFKHSFEDFIFSSNFGTGYKAPTLYELSHDGGNDLKPEYNKSFDIALQYKDIEIKYFRNRITDLIDYNYNGTPTDYSDDYYSNIEGTSKLSGYEISYNNDIAKHTLLSLTYTNLIAKDEDGVKLLRVPRETLKVSLDYYGFKNLHLNLNGNYVGERLDLSSTQTGNYTVWNSVANYEINKDTSVYLKVDNIFDKYYQTVNDYSSAPRSFYVGLKYNF